MKNSNKVFGKGLHYGESVWDKRSGDISFSEYILNSNNLEPHSHKNGYMSIIIEGEVLEICNGLEYKRTPGMAVYHPASGVHSNQLMSKYSRLFHIEWLDESVPENSQILSDFLIIFDENVMQLIRSLYFGIRKGEKIDLLAERSAEVLQQASKSDCKKQFLRCPNWFSNLIKYIDNHYSENVTLESLSERAGVHPVHISRSFKKYMQCSFSAYLIKIRIEKACEKIKANNMPLSSLAYEMGFFDQSHFSKSFKSYTGFSPSGYKKLYDIS